MDEVLLKILAKLDQIERNQYKMKEELDCLRDSNSLSKHELRQQFSRLDQRIHGVEASFTLLGLKDIEGKVDVLNKQLLDVSAATELLKRECK